MVSLTWVYVISLSIVSAAGMASAFVGNNFYPIKGGDLGIPPPTEDQVTKALLSAANLAKQRNDASKEELALKTASSPPEPTKEEEVSNTEQTESPASPSEEL